MDDHSKYHSKNTFCGYAGPEEMQHLYELNRMKRGEFEHIWKYAKDQISNHQFDSFPTLITTFQQTVMGRKYTYQI